MPRSDAWSSPAARCAPTRSSPGCGRSPARGSTTTTLVLVHDAARPAVSAELVSSIAAAAAAGDWAVVPVVPVVDSLKRVRDERVVAPIDARRGRRRPDAAGRAARRPASRDRGGARLGAARSPMTPARWPRPACPVHTIEGDPANRKLTEPGDVVAMRAVLAAGAAARRRRRAAERPAVGDRLRRPSPGRGPSDAPRAASPGDDEPRGPLGHSDGDAALHALIDALLGAAQLGDVGTLFPPGEAEWEGVDSAELRDPGRRAARRGRLAAGERRT